MEKTKQLIIEITPSLHKKLKLKALKNDITLKQLVTDLLETKEVKSNE